jgi:hypothetical protein
MAGVRGVVEHKPVGETNWEYRVGKALGWSEETSHREKLQGYGMLSYYRPVMLKMESTERLRKFEEKEDLVFRSYVDDVVKITKKQSKDSEKETDCLEEVIRTLQERSPESTGQELPGKEAGNEHDEKKELRAREVYPEAELTEQKKIFLNEDITKSEDLRISVEEFTLENEHLNVGTAALNQKDDIRQSAQEGGLYDIWMEFVYSERIQDGMYGNLVETNKEGCMCGKGRMTFPHWPPTSFNEAKSLFDNCLNEENTHRKHITRSWWAFVAIIAAIRPWKQQIKQEIYIQKEREIRERCDIRFDEDTPVKRQRRKADCQGICEPTLRKQRYACLCDCGHHREECPVHQKNL